MGTFSYYILTRGSINLSGWCYPAFEQLTPEAELRGVNQSLHLPPGNLRQPSLVRPGHIGKPKMRTQHTILRAGG